MTAEQKQFLAEKYFSQREFLLEYAESYLHNYALSEEAVQQTFEIACRKIDDFYSCPTPDAWLTKTLSLVLSNVDRRYQAERNTLALLCEYRPDLAPSPEVQLPMRISYGPLVDTPHFRLLYEYEIIGRDLSELAEELGINEAACKKRLERARAFLKKKLREAQK